MKRILTDIDDTVLAWADHFQNWITEEKGIHANGRLLDYKGVSDWMGLPEEEVDAMVKEFNSDPHHFSTLPPMIDAADYVPKLHGEGWQFIGITAVDPSMVEARLINLENVFGFRWTDVHCVGLHGPKRETLAQYDGTWWIEDNAGHAVTGAELGHKSVLINRSRNALLNHPEVRRVSTWREVYEIIQGEA